MSNLLIDLKKNCKHNKKKQFTRPGNGSHSFRRMRVENTSWVTSSFLRQAKKHFSHSQDKIRAKARVGSQIGSRIGNQVRGQEKGKMPKEKVKTAKVKARAEKGKDLVTVAVNMVTVSEIAQVLARA